MRKYLHRRFLTWRSSCLQIIFKLGVPRKFAIFLGKVLREAAFNEITGLFRPAILLKRESNTGVFLWILRCFWEQLYRTPPVSASGLFPNTSVVASSMLFYTFFKITYFLRTTRGWNWTFWTFWSWDVHKQKIKIQWYLYFF